MERRDSACECASACVRAYSVVVSVVQHSFVSVIGRHPQPQELAPQRGRRRSGAVTAACPSLLLHEAHVGHRPHVEHSVSSFQSALMSVRPEHLGMDLDWRSPPLPHCSTGIRHTQSCGRVRHPLRDDAQREYVPSGTSRRPPPSVCLTPPHTGLPCAAHGARSGRPRRVWWTARWEAWSQSQSRHAHPQRARLDDSVCASGHCQTTPPNTPRARAPLCPLQNGVLTVSKKPQSATDA